MEAYHTRKNFELFAKKCLFGKKPSCSCMCPLNLDIPALIGHIQESDYTLAYKLYQSQAVFPGIVSRICNEPCRESCVRRKLDGSLSILELERACINFSKTVEPPRFNLPYKNKKIAIIGAGLCGLACAQKLGAKNYEITIFESTDRIGGRLWNLMESEIFLNEINLQFKYINIQFELNTEIHSLDNLSYDAILIATGENGNNFGLLDSLNIYSFGTIRPGIFLAGNILNTSSIEDIKQGATVSHSIEKYIKIASMEGIPETFLCKESQLQIELSNVKKKSPVIPQSQVGYTSDEAIKESERCLKCNCTICYDNCELFRYFERSPNLMVEDAVASLHTKASFTGQKATRTMASCNLCGLCGDICPQEIDMGQFFDNFRHFKKEDNMFPPAFHDFFIRDMLFSNQEAYFMNTPPGFDKASYLFFPGCQLAASNPLYVEKTYYYLLEKIADTAIILGCCGAPADWAADSSLHASTIEKLRGDWKSTGKPIIIFACPTCKHQFERFIPEADTVSLYDIFLDKGLPFSEYPASREACVFDPCASRYDLSMQKSVREILRKKNFQLSELYHSRSKAQCCGWGGHIALANPELKNIIVKSRVSYSNLPYITYCTNCRDVFLDEGKECAHILDLIFDLDKENYKTPSLSQRRRNRLLTKKNLLEKLWNINMDENISLNSVLTVVIPDELALKMKKELVLEDDAIHTIQYCEKTGNIFYLTEKGVYTGYCQIGAVTYWVEYVKKSQNYILNNVYSHRIEIMQNIKNN